MKEKFKDVRVVIFISILMLSLLILIIPLNLLEYLSLEVVGEPPINGRTWMEGVDELGGELSMRMMGIMGIAIMMLAIPFILKKKSKPIEKREVKNGEVLTFLMTTMVFFFVNFLIGYAWWDPDGFLGMGPLFLHSMLSLIILGLLPMAYMKLFHFEKDDLANSKKDLRKMAVAIIILAYGYGLVSSIWHCCSFFDPKMYFFFFIIKLVQLWAMCTFFFKYGFKLFLSKFRPWMACILISVLFGFCYPWHTIGFALTFTLFGLGLAILTRKTDSYLPGLILLYFAYIFHAGLAWNGAMPTFLVIYPISLGILGFLTYFSIKTRSQ